MSLLDVALGAQFLLALAAVVAAVAGPPAYRNRLCGSLSAGMGLAGAVAGATILGGATTTWSLVHPLGPDLGALAPLTLAPDRLGGFFLLVVGLVGAVASVFGIGYAHGAAASRTAWTAYPLFLLGMQLVPAAGDVVTFLVGWEVMALASTVLVLADHAHRARVRSAGLWYAVMTHLSFALLAAGFAVVVSEAGSTRFTDIAGMPVGEGTAGVAFALLTLGFVTKAGLVPVHVWLPRAHPEAPSHVSAVMSAAMVKMGVYGVLLTVTRLLPDAGRWWGLALLALALPSALYGILQASVASDLKRLLAYSTTENVGLILTAVAVSMLTRHTGTADVSQVALIAALLLVVSHAAFKTVLFLAAGAVLSATGERDLDRMGGLAGGMPVTAAAFGVAALGAAALPVTSGFVAEWVLLQSLIHGDVRTDRLTTALLPAVVAVVALTAGLALLTFVKAFGIAFLARARSEGAALAHEVSRSMRAALVLGAAAVFGLGLFPGVTASAAVSALGDETVSRGPSGMSVAIPVGLGGLELPTLRALLDPTSLLVLGALLTVPVVAISWALARTIPRRAVDLQWGCGGVRDSPRMQSPATSFAEPLVRVFGDTLRPTQQLHVERAKESRFVVVGASYRQRVGDVIEDRVYRPAARWLGRVGDGARRVQNGSIHRYLAFSFAALVVLLVVVVR